MELTVPRLDDGVVSLRPPEAGDVDAIVAACQDPEIPRWTRVPSPYTRQHAVEFVERSARTWADGTDAPFVIVDASGELLGAIGVHRLGGEEGGPEVGYWVKREARGRGVATGALRLLSGWACGELATRVVLQADVRNAASRRVADKTGYRYVGDAPAPADCGECETMAVYALAADDLGGA
jgi:RimJ/RimL family protein N-acetyltransferase